MIGRGFDHQGIARATKHGLAYILVMVVARRAKGHSHVDQQRGTVERSD